MSIYDIEIRTLDGKAVSMEAWRGQVLLIVNVASRCGYTPQYAGLEALHRKYGDQGFCVLGFPCNQFGAQEPGSESEIKSFCEARYGVDFPLTKKEHVVGAAAHPLYQWIAKELGEAAVPRWNFHKYLIGKDGALAGTFGSRTEPQAAELKQAIEAVLK